MDPREEIGDEMMDRLVLTLVGLGANDGGRVNPKNILARPASSDSRIAFMEAQDRGLLDGNGWVTDDGYAALRDSD